MSGTMSASTGTSVPQNWLAQKVCVDSQNKPVSVDPYSASDPYGNGCSGYTERNIQSSDTVPYYRYIDGGTGTPSRYWYAYSYPVTSPTGEQMFVMARQFTPSNVAADWYVNPAFYPGHTHWDMYRIQAGYVSNATTRDNSGFNQTFFGNTNGSATPYNGWIDFPVSYLSSFGPSAHSTFATRNVYWEQSGLSWPLPSQSAPTGGSTQTTWNLIPGYTFASGKKMNTLVNYHQSAPQPTSSNPDTGHMEVWYFTMPYGASRWEVWSAASCLASSCSSYIQNKNCAPAAPTKFPYGSTSVTYYRTNCVDWTKTMLATTTSTLPRLPIPEADMLTNIHFSNDPPGTTGRASNWTLGSGLSLAQLTSTTSTDTRGGKYPGTRYIRVACAASCSTSSSISQDVPVSSNGVYAYGVTVRAESSAGTMTVSLSQVDANGNVLANSTVVTTQSVTANGDQSSCSSSVVNCATYVGGTTPVTLLPGAVRLRETISPRTAGVSYDITQAYVAKP